MRWWQTKVSKKSAAKVLFAMPAKQSHIKVCRAGSGATFECTALGIEGPILIIQGFPWPLFENDLVDITWQAQDDYVQTLRALVTKEGSNPTLEAKSSSGAFMQRRQSPRFDFALESQMCAVHTKVIKPGKLFTARTVDVSAEGMRFVSSLPFAPCDTIEVSLPTSQGPCALRGQILRVEGSSRSWRSDVIVIWQNLDEEKSQSLQNILTQAA